MDRYDARLWRSSTMTSFAGIKSWNFSGRRGVNSATAWRTVAGSNEVMGRNDSDVNWGNGLAARWTPRGKDADSSLPAHARGQIASVTRLRSWTIQGRGLSADNLSPWPQPIHGLSKPLRCRERGLFADAPVCADCRRTRMVRGKGRLPSVACPCLNRGRGLAAFSAMSRTLRADHPRSHRDCFADAETLASQGVRLVLH